MKNREDQKEKDEKKLLVSLFLLCESSLGFFFFYE